MIEPQSNSDNNYLVTLQHKLVMLSNHNCVYFTEPTLRKLALYLRGVKDWEEFGMCLLPEDDLDMIEVKLMSTFKYHMSLVFNSMYN